MIAERLGSGPIIGPHMDRRMGTNINGPSLIRVPPWVKDRLGAYYLYFSAHDGSYIRLACADALAGPWRMHEPGVLELADSYFEDHIASPDVIVDAERRQIRLYYHGVADASGEQKTRVALSSDGLSFQARPDILLDWYARIFRRDGVWHALTMPGRFWRSSDGLAPFTPGPLLFSSAMRHAAVRLTGDRLDVFHTNVGDCPEAILVSSIDLRGDWSTWQATPPRVLLAPERDYEGGDLPLAPSVRGAVSTPVRELRDPAVFVEEGRTFLVYAVAGEAGLALAELRA